MGIFNSIMRNTKVLHSLNCHVFATIDSDSKEDDIRESLRKNQFSHHHRIEKIPIIRSLARWIYVQEPIYCMALLTILILFTAVKAPFFDLPFTGHHSMKYSTYVEPALNMVQHNDPTWYQKKYSAKFPANPEGIFHKFDHLPLMEWGLFIAYKYLPFGNLEFKTRLFTHFIGILILIFSYQFFKKWFPKKLTLILLLLLAVNPLVTFATYVTVLDSLTILLMFLSLIFINRYIDSEAIGDLFWAGIIFGIGNSFKYSLFLWLAPLSMVFIYSFKKNNPQFIRNYMIYLTLGILPVITGKTSLFLIPSSPLKAFLLFVGWVIFYSFCYFFFARKAHRMGELIGEFMKRKVLCVLLSFTIILIAVVAAFVVFRNRNFASFLTDSSLILNFKMYKYMLFSQFPYYLTPIIFWMGMIGLVTVLIWGSDHIKKITLAFLLGSLFYWVIASKSIFIHDYYTLIIIILFSLMASTVIYFAFNILPGKMLKSILVLFLAAMILPGTYRSSAHMIGKNEDVSPVINFILENTDEKDVIMHHGVLTPLNIYTNRTFIYPHSFNFDIIRKEIKEMGFAETMKKYRVKYLFTPYYEPIYEDFAPMFSKTDIKYPSWNRNMKIFNEIGIQNSRVNNSLREIDRTIAKFNVKSKFKLEAEMGPYGKYKIYSFID